MNKMLYFAFVFLYCMTSDLVADDPKRSDSLSIDAVSAISMKIAPDKVELTVKGKINKLSPARFDLDTLMKLKSAYFETTNHWTGQKEKFTGVSFISLLQFLGLDASASNVEVIATNSYRITIKISDLKKYDYLLSYKLNDKLYSEHDPKNDKGPIAVAINFDRHPELNREVYKHHLVWFVETIIVQ